MKVLRYFSVLWVLVFAVACSDSSSGSSSAPAEVIEIRTEAQLRAMADDLTASYVLMNDITLTEEWTPIGEYAWVDGYFDYDLAFTGNFNGCGYKIKNLTINLPDKNYVGLFGLTINSTISNLGVEIGEGGVTGKGLVGGIVGWATNNSTIENSYVKGNVTGTGNQVAGIVGVLSSSTIENSYVKGNVTGARLVGGIAGELAESTVMNSYSTGNVVGTSNFVGGIVAAIYGSTIKNNAAINSAVSGTTDVARVVGYIGVNDDVVENNFALANMLVNGVTVSDSPLNGTGKPMSDFSLRATYETGLGWKFGNNKDNPWKMPSGGGYPILYWE